MNFNIKGNNSITALILVVLNVAIIIFAFKPMIVSLNQVNVSQKAAKIELKEKNTKLENLKSVQSKLSNLSETLAVMQKALPKGQDISALLVSAESLAGVSGLGISSFTPPTAAAAAVPTSAVDEDTTANKTNNAAVSPTVTQKTGVSSVSYQKTLIGGYAQFISFLDNADKNIRPTSVSLVNISGGGTDKPLNFNVKLTTFFQQ